MKKTNKRGAYVTIRKRAIAQVKRDIRKMEKALHNARAMLAILEDGE